MKIISTENDYYLIEKEFNNVLDKKKSLPQNVFGQEFKFFLFIDFYDLLSPRKLFNYLKPFLLGRGENTFWLTAIDPDPKLYYGKRFNFYGAIEVSCLDTDADYLNALENYPKESIADALWCRGDLLAFFSSSHEWVVYGDRDYDIAICAFKNQQTREKFKSVYDGKGLLSDVYEGADLVYYPPYRTAIPADELERLKKAFIKNYSDQV